MLLELEKGNFHCYVCLLAGMYRVCMIHKTHQPKHHSVSSQTCVRCFTRKDIPKTRKVDTKVGRTKNFLWWIGPSEFSSLSSATSSPVMWLKSVDLQESRSANLHHGRGVKLLGGAKIPLQCFLELPPQSSWKWFFFVRNLWNLNRTGDPKAPNKQFGTDFTAMHKWIWFLRLMEPCLPPTWISPHCLPAAASPLLLLSLPRFASTGNP